VAPLKQRSLQTPLLVAFLVPVAVLTLFTILLLPLAAGAAAPSLAGVQDASQMAALAPFAITAHLPVTNQVGVPLTATIQATFDDDVNASTVTSGTFAVHGHLGGLATGSFAYDGGTRTVTLDPDRAFHAGEVLRVSATRGILSDSIPPSNLTRYGWQFTAGVVRERCVSGFTDIEAGLVGVLYGAVAWGDYDNDGDLDILLSGFDGLHRQSRVYRNNGPAASPVFSNIAAGLFPLRESAAAWGDYDNDGDLDILLTGQDANFNPVSKLYRNDGGGAFTDVATALRGGAHGSVAWGDYDNDGDLDVLLTGVCGGSIDCAEIYRNDGASGFTDINAGFPSTTAGSVAWGDYDNDGKLDVLLASVNHSEVFHNDGGGTFTDIDAGLPGVDDSSVAWGDYDNDGDLDILLTGYTPAPSCISRIYRNDGGGAFTDIAAGLTGVRDGSVAWGDYDNDGDLDILLTGRTLSGTKVVRVYRNGGASGFAEVSGTGLARVDKSSVAWGDYDNDGDLDILVSGDGPLTRVYRNDDCRVVAHEPGAHEVGVAPGDAISATFNTNIDIGTATSASFFVHGHLGGMASGSFSQDGGTKTITLDPDRNFHAGEVMRVSVTEAISTGSGSGLTPYGWQFTAGPVLERCPGAFTDIGAGLPGVRYSSVAWGDYDNDGDLDFLLTGGTGADRVSTVYRNNGDESFTDISAGLTAVNQGAVAWGDYDHDGDLDILLTGNTGSGHVSLLYRNDGSDVFTDIGAGLTGVRYSSVAWGDYDNDGDLDILLTGGSGAGRVALVYRNDGTFGFTDIGAALTGVNQGSAAWGDVDNDGDLDILLTGQDSGANPLSRVYRNDGSGSFTDIGAALAPVWYSSAAWGDYNNDSHLDILLTGRDGAGSPLSKVYRNNGDTASPAFTDIGAALVAVNNGSVAWSDVDNDGDLDIVLTGYDGTQRVAKVYRNDGAGSFTDIDAALTGVNEASVACGDYDNDGDLDILLTGSTGTSRVSRVYRNEDCPELALVKSVDLSTPQPGQRITYTIVVSNSGGTATGAVVSDNLPAELASAGPVALDPPGAGTTGTPPLLVHDATIAAGETITATFPVTVNLCLAAGTVITNTAAVSCTQISTPVEASVPLTVANAAPTLGTVNPSTGTGSTGVTTYFTTTWHDDNGWDDLKQCWFHIGADANIVGNVTLLYNNAKNKLWLLDDSGTLWTGGYAPGSASTLENSQAIVYCELSAAEGSGDTVSVRWAIEFKPGYEGAKKTGLKCKDRSKARAKASWKGTWEVTAGE
jgi:uncharacterized repeat protein (TIGR01451 family)